MFAPAIRNQRLSVEIAKVKVCLVGEASVGKTSLVRRYVLDQFDDRYVPTVGAKVMKREVSVPVPAGDVWVVLTLWDIMGERTFRELLREAYFHGLQGILAVADLTRPDTVRALPDWVSSARRVSGRVPVSVLGNKADLATASGAGDALAEVAGALLAPRWRTSAKTGENVEAAFQDLAKRVVRGGAWRGDREGPEAPADTPIPGGGS